MARTWGLVGAMVAGTMMAGCSPLTVSIGMGPDSKPPREVVVKRDEGAGADKVAMIDLRGVIVDAPRPTMLGPGENPMDYFVTRLRRAEEDRRVKAVIIRVNSPGGTVTASDMLHDEIRRFRERSGKPVIASLGEVAASGGYYVALAADEIVTQPTTITGSIGVVIQTMNFSDGLSRIGIRGRAVTSGRNKDLANPMEAAREEHYAILQGMVDEFHGRFVGLVETRRLGVVSSEMPELTDGRVVTGSEAVRRGLADSEGDIESAFERAKSKAGVSRASLVKYAERGRAMRTPYASGPESPASGIELNLVQVRIGEDVMLPPGAWYLWSPGGW